MCTHSQGNKKMCKISSFGREFAKSACFCCCCCWCCNKPTNQQQQHSIKSNLLKLLHLCATTKTRLATPPSLLVCLFVWRRVDGQTLIFSAKPLFFLSFFSKTAFHLLDPLLYGSNNNNNNNNKP